MLSKHRLAAGLVSSPAYPQDSTDSTPKLLLTAQRLRRLERERTRQTVRWVNFETRVNAVPDSPERGFELALYYAVTHDEKRGREAVEWALAHKGSCRQVALIQDWCGRLLSDEEKKSLASAVCPIAINGQGPTFSVTARDALFAAIARDQDPHEPASSWKEILSQLQSGRFADSQTLYASLEYLAAMRSLQHVDLRQDDPRFFSGLPIEFLLSLQPTAVEHPDWMTHIAALTLVALDPNAESSQFMQGWAIEDRQMLREGPGVAYELLWADPYLPGVGYQNLDPWAYDSMGRLFARVSWNSDACWAAVSSHGVQQENCPAGWQNSSNVFGHLTLMPLGGHCADVPHRSNHNDTTILWKLQPHQKLFYFSEQRKSSVEADSAGMWRVPENVEGHVCTSLDRLKRP